jgi:transcriptional regulator with GAF, ATPase, and Fis domain
VVSDPDRERSVSQAFVALADTMADDYDIIDLLDQLIAHSVTLLAADAAGIMLGDPHRQLRVAAASSEDAQLMELLQLQNEQGPCLDCYHSGAPVSVPNLADATQWPAFTTAVTEAGPFQSVHALPLRQRRETIGALNLFHRTPGPLPQADLALGQALADVATIGILQKRAIRRGELLNQQLKIALASRVVVEQAKGVLAQYHGISVDAAFDRLRRYARAHSLRLANVARQLATRRLNPATITPAPTSVPR